jgi:hypothetical protein
VGSRLGNAGHKQAGENREEETANSCDSCHPLILQDFCQDGMTGRGNYVSRAACLAG